MTAQSSKDKLIVALDIETFAEARELINILSPSVEIFKIGSQLFTSCGPVVVRYLLAMGKKVFLDLKFHDIPNTVANAISSAIGLYPGQSIFMLTVHTQGEVQMLKAAVAAASQKSKELNVNKPFIVGVTVLTSEEKTDNISRLVLERAHLAKQCGLDGVVASPQEAAFIRKELGKDFMIVTPGIRPKDAEANDQKRTATAFESIQNGSDFLVVGRPIIKAANPLEAAQKILEEIEQAQPK